MEVSQVVGGGKREKDGEGKRERDRERKRGVERDDEVCLSYHRHQLRFWWEHHGES